MIGFDLDGVFVNDITSEAASDATTLAAMLEARKHQLPIFPLANLAALLPGRTFAIVTARPSLDAADTKAWCFKHLKLKLPESKFVLCTRSSSSVASDLEAAEFKASIIVDLKISHFVESSLVQARHIRQVVPNCKVIHFGTLVEDALSKELE